MDIAVEIGAVYEVIIIHRAKARKVWVKVLPDSGCVFGPKCMVVGGETTKLLHLGLIRCVDSIRFHVDKKIDSLRHVVFDL